MELRQENFQTLASSKEFKNKFKTYKANTATATMEKKIRKITEIPIEEAPETTMKDIKFYGFFVLGMIFSTIILFNIYQFVVHLSHNNWAHPLLLSLLAFSSSFVVGFTFSYFSILGMKRFWENRRLRFLQFPEDKITEIEVDHYDYVRIVRPIKNEEENNA